jgi:hypothetical protein
MRKTNDHVFESSLAEDATARYFPQLKPAAPEMIDARRGIVSWTASAAVTLEAIN